MTSLSAGKRKEAAEEDGGAVNSMTDSVEDCSWPQSTSVLRRRCSASRIPSPHSSSENWPEESCWAPGNSMTCSFCWLYKDGLNGGPA